MSNVPHTSSGSDPDARYAVMEEKKRKRMLSNRESARRSRLKRQKQTEDMINEIGCLQMKIKEGNRKCDVVMQKIAMVESENLKLRSEKMRLANYMNSLETMLMKLKQNDTVDDEIPDISEACRMPWQLGVWVGGEGSSMQPIMSSGMFKI